MQRRHIEREIRAAARVRWIKLVTSVQMKSMCSTAFNVRQTVFRHGKWNDWKCGIGSPIKFILWNVRNQCSSTHQHMRCTKCRMCAIGRFSDMLVSIRPLTKHFSTTTSATPRMPNVCVCVRFISPHSYSHFSWRFYFVCVFFFLRFSRNASWYSLRYAMMFGF